LGATSSKHVPAKKGYTMIQLLDLAKPLPDKWIAQKPGVSYDAKYISHGDCQQALLAKLGPTSQRVVKIIYGTDGTTIQGVILEMRFIIDLELTVIEEAGECERPGDNNALNLKMAISDGIKRCCMRVGIGLELYTAHYDLERALQRRADEQEQAELEAE
jgi:hypothetical protein